MRSSNSLEPPSHYLTVGTQAIKTFILQKLQKSPSCVDGTLLSCQQKLHLYKDGICPCLLWDLATNDLLYSWVVKNLEALATRYLKNGQDWPNVLMLTGYTCPGIKEDFNSLQLRSSLRK